MKTETKYFSDDGKEFAAYSDCHNYEVRQSIEKNGLGDFTTEELTIGHGVEVVDHLPCTAPWMGAFGSCLVKIYEVKREDGKVKFGVGNVAPPILGWVNADDFYAEWPK